VSREHWERESSNWAAWARRPEFDAYWKYSPAFFELVPPHANLTLEVGCGEGRVSRDLAARGHHVTGVDTSPTLIRLARGSDPKSAYLQSDAAALPFAAESFDLVVLYNSLMDFDDIEGGVREAARVLRHGGALCVCITHPMTDAGTFASREPDSPFVIKGSYLGERRWVEIETERDGLQMHFKGWAYSLEAYFTALERAGFMIQAVREPRVPDENLDRFPSEYRWLRIPVFLMFRAVRL
jgi:ubiquinone/menaquinone biosynthesis C-methylase UbiE